MHRRTALSLLPAASVVRLAQSQTGQGPANNLIRRGGLSNLTAFARLFGYVRHFHPSDEAARADWDAVAITGVQVVETLAGSRQLARTLQEFFAPVAPTLRVFTEGERVPEPWTPPAGLGGLETVRWKHRGFGPENPERAWRMERVREPVVEDRFPRPKVLTLDGGVRALLPITVLADGAGTLPRSKAFLEPAAASYSGEDRATRLAGVVIAWNVFQHFYPYFDVVRVDWSKALTVALESAATDNAASFVHTLRRMLAKLQDGHGLVYWEAATDATAPVGWDWIENKLIVTDMPDNQGQPIDVGDVVISVDGKPAAQAILDLQPEISSATPQHRIFKTLLQTGVWKNRFGSLGEGPMDRPLLLEVSSLGHAEVKRTVTLQRKTARLAMREIRPPSVHEVRPNVIYVDLTILTPEEWESALPKMVSAKAVVFDLRGGIRKLIDPAFFGHLTRAPLLSERWFIPSITEPDHQNMQFEEDQWTVTPREPYIAGRKMFLADGRIISYPDSLLAMVEHHKLGDIVGETTGGTTGNTHRGLMIPGRYGFVWTGMKAVKQDGSRHHGVGVVPTVPVRRTLAGVAAKRDEVLEGALELLDRETPPIKRQYSK